jgi:hypothetical protein
VHHNEIDGLLRHVRQPGERTDLDLEIVGEALCETLANAWCRFGEDQAGRLIGHQTRMQGFAAAEVEHNCIGTGQESQDLGRDAAKMHVAMARINVDRMI